MVVGFICIDGIRGGDGWRKRHVCSLGCVWEVLPTSGGRRVTGSTRISFMEDGTVREEDEELQPTDCCYAEWSGLCDPAELES